MLILSYGNARDLLIRWGCGAIMAAIILHDAIDRDDVEIHGLVHIQFHKKTELYYISYIN
jgi:hypothetical protein